MFITLLLYRIFFFNASINPLLWRYCLVDCLGTSSSIFTSGFLSRQTARYSALTIGTGTDLSSCAYFSFCPFLLITFFHLYTSLSFAWGTSNRLVFIDTMLQVQDTVYSAQIWFRKGPDTVYFFFWINQYRRWGLFSHISATSLRGRLFWTCTLFISKYKIKRQLQQFLVWWYYVLL